MPNLRNRKGLHWVSIGCVFEEWEEERQKHCKSSEEFAKTLILFWKRGHPSVANASVNTDEETKAASYYSVERTCQRRPKPYSPVGSPIQSPSQPYQNLRRQRHYAETRKRKFEITENTESPDVTPIPESCGQLALPLPRPTKCSRELTIVVSTPTVKGLQLSQQSLEITNNSVSSSELAYTNKVSAETPRELELSRQSEKFRNNSVSSPESVCTAVVSPRPEGELELAQQSKKYLETGDASSESTPSSGTLWKVVVYKKQGSCRPYIHIFKLTDNKTKQPSTENKLPIDKDVLQSKEQCPENNPSVEPKLIMPAPPVDPCFNINNVSQLVLPMSLTIPSTSSNALCFSSAPAVVPDPVKVVSNFAPQGPTIFGNQLPPGVRKVPLTLFPSVIYKRNSSNAIEYNNQIHTESLVQSTVAVRNGAQEDVLEKSIVSEPSQPCGNEASIAEPDPVSESIIARIKKEPESWDTPETYNCAELVPSTGYDDQLPPSVVMTFECEVSVAEPGMTTEPNDDTDNAPAMMRIEDIKSEPVEDISEAPTY